MEHVARIPALLDPLKRRVVALEADELSNALGREIRHISLPSADVRAGMLAEGMPEAIADRMLDLERYFRENRASGVTEDVRKVTGREPRRFAEYVQATAATGVWNAALAQAAHR